MQNKYCLLCGEDLGKFAGKRLYCCDAHKLKFFRLERKKKAKKND